MLPFPARSSLALPGHPFVLPLLPVHQTCAKRELVVLALLQGAGTMPQGEHIELHRKRYGRRLDHEERMRKKEARSVKKRAAMAQRALGIKGKMFAKERAKEKATMRKTIAMHEERDKKHKADDGQKGSAVPAYLLEREQARPGFLGVCVVWVRLVARPSLPCCAVPLLCCAVLCRLCPRSVLLLPTHDQTADLMNKRRRLPGSALLLARRWSVPRCLAIRSSKSARKRRASGRCRCPR